MTKAVRKPKARSKLAPGKLSEQPRMGRPTTYLPEHCELIVKLAKEGQGVVGWAVAIGVDRITLLNWRDNIPDFSTAFHLAKAHEQQWWEEKGRKSLGEKTFQASVWHKSMAARFRHDYTERTEVTGAGGGAVKVDAQRTIDVSGMDADQLEDFRRMLQLALGKPEG